MTTSTNLAGLWRAAASLYRRGKRAVVKRLMRTYLDQMFHCRTRFGQRVRCGPGTDVEQLRRMQRLGLAPALARARRH